MLLFDEGIDESDCLRGAAADPMKLTAIALLKWNGDREPVLFGMGADLSSFGFFQRGSVKEMLTFVARTVAKRTLIGQRQTVQNEEYYCHAFNRDGLVGIKFFVLS